MKILVTGGAGFVGSRLLKYLSTNPKYKLTSLDNYFTGRLQNHTYNVKYIKGNTWEADKIFKGETFDIIYHFGEYSRISTSFDDIKLLNKSILQGTPVILELAKKWNAKLIYSASSSGLGNNGLDQNLSPYSWMKSKMIELIKNYNKWFGLEYQICYFYNVFGPGQITEGKYATVIGIFQQQYNDKKPLTIVSPGTQKRIFTHIDDIVNGLVKVLNTETKNHEWYLRSEESISILNLCKLFNTKYKIIPERLGERNNAQIKKNDTKTTLNWNTIYNIRDYVKSVTIN